MLGHDHDRCVSPVCQLRAARVLIEFVERRSAVSRLNRARQRGSATAHAVLTFIHLGGCDAVTVRRIGRSLRG